MILERAKASEMNALLKRLGLAPSGKPLKKNKFNAKVIYTEDGRFDSQAEYKEWCDLKALQGAGKIKWLKRQVVYPLYAWSAQGKVKIGSYKADFVWTEPSGEVVADKKGHITAAFRRTQKIFAANYGFEIRVMK